MFTVVHKQTRMKILLLFLFVSLELGQSSLKVNHIALKVNHIVIVNETGVYHPLDLYLLCLHTEIKDSVVH